MDDMGRQYKSINSDGEGTILVSLKTYSVIIILKYCLIT